MIYLDTSVALSALFKELAQPPARLWAQPLFSSRLLEYEIMTRLHALRCTRPVLTAGRMLIDGVQLIGLACKVLARALEPFPIEIRTLDAMHLATAVHLQSSGLPIALASYDKRMRAAAQALGIELFAL